MAGHRLEICSDVSVDGQRHIEEDYLADTRKCFARLRVVSFEMIQQARMDEREITAVGAQVQFRRHADTLVGGAHTQPVPNVIEIVVSGEQP